MALEFDKTNYVDCGDGASFNIIDNLSVFFWAKVNLDTAGIMGKYETGEREWGIAEVDGKIRIQFGDPNDGSYEGSWWSVAVDHFSASEFKHFGFGFSGGNVDIYVNGVEVASQLRDGAIPNTLYNGTATFKIGKFSTVTFKGTTYGIRIYNRILSLAERKSIFDGRGSDNIVNGLVFRALMNEGTDGATAAGANSVIDISGQGNHGTPVNNPIYRAAPMKLLRPMVIE